MEQQSTIALPRSGLTIEGDDLVKTNPRNGTRVGRHPIETLSVIEMRQCWDPLPLGLAIILVAFAAAAKTRLSTPVWSWGLTIVAGALALVCAIGSRRRVLHLEADGGEADYELFDLPDDCAGFVLSLKSARASAGDEGGSEIGSETRSQSPAPLDSMRS